MAGLTRRAMRNEIRTLQAQLDQERATAARAKSHITRLQRLDQDRDAEITRLQERIVALEAIVQDLRHYQGRKDMDLRAFVANAHRAEMAEHTAVQARRDLTLARIRIQELERAAKEAAA